jgi:hypothetical protein
MAARAAAALAFLCGVFGLLAGMTAHEWKLGAIGWFTGGALLTLLALFALVDGALAAQHR